MNSDRPTTIHPVQERQRVLDYYTEQSAASSPGRHAALLDPLSAGPAGVG